MTATENTSTEGKKTNGAQIDEEQISTQTLVTAVLQHLGDAYADKDYSLADIDEWEPIKCGYYSVDEGAPESVRVTGKGTHADFAVESAADSDQAWSVDYCRNGINFIAETETETARGGLNIEFDPDTARNLARALYMAAEEYDRRPKQERGER